ncbi:tricorn protease [Endobacter medicaginis]|uniref:Tricorn protease homolog n=1 Tax=Endobacter medicaginis TaxID=1181271 RepID=A0A839URD5_9PROT|nr:S41 family peptidase [Endobacter medicaginis]MBB3172356.1 tricorn protease [Endobacter medicaginis]MCX5476299.1 S41 family peptidase [Endobacter medicaginis]NVN29725.1 PD40 domain-containing protein [Endobacter medicaginis]
MFRRALFAATALLMPVAAHAVPGYLRDPSAAAGLLAFVAEQTVWTVPQSGGQAHRLTDRPAGSVGADPHPVVAPDGKSVVFAASYDGPTELYLIGVDGGTPKRLTYNNTKTTPLGWDARAGVLFTMAGDSLGVHGQVVGHVDPRTGAQEIYPLAGANDAALSPDGRWLVFVRFGLAATGDHLRQYRGGAMAQLWRFDLHDTSPGAEAQRIGPADANWRRPMWWKGRLVVVSDRDGRDNLWSLAADGSDPRQITHFTDAGVRQASLDGDAVVFQLGADLHRTDLATGHDTLLPIELLTDRPGLRPYWIDRPLGFLTDIAVAPKGDLALVTARGHAVIAATGPRRRVEIGAADGSRLRDAVFSEDAKTVFAIADTSGEEEVWAYPADGAGPGRQLTHDGDTERTGLHPSPDGRLLAITDMKGRLRILDIASGAQTLVDDAASDGTTEHDDVVWSHDSRTLAFSRTRGVSLRDQLALYDVGARKLHWVTDDRYDSGHPAFSPDGHFLYFLSARHFELANGSPWGDRNTGPVFDRRVGIYALALQPDATFPFRPRDELSPPREVSPDTPHGAASDPAAPKTPRERADAAEAKRRQGVDRTPPAIAWQGLETRLYQVPQDAGNYAALAVNAGYLYLLDRADEDEPGRLVSVHIDDEDPKVETVAPKVIDFALSGDGKTLLLATPGDKPAPALGLPGTPRLLLIPAVAKAPDKPDHTVVALDDWRLRVDPASEWRQMYLDAWRMDRAFFYDPALRGVNWSAVRDRGLALIDRLGDRADLSDLLGQTIGELSALHSQIRPPDTEAPNPALDVAGLGARLTPGKDGWRIARIYATDPDLPDHRGPLQAPWLDIRAGDLITAIDARPTAGIADPASLLTGLAGRQVLLQWRSATQGTAHKAIVIPCKAKTEAALAYSDWELTRAARVQAASGGRYGYLHLRAMGPSDIETFVREFYANIDRDGLIIDVRDNHGGNIDSWVINALLRRAWMFWKRYDHAPAVNMQQAFRGHVVLLVDQLTYSDGETVSNGIKTLKLAPLIGERTSGAGVWLSDRNRLIDNGVARAAQMPQFAMNGAWQVENHGVEPDETVDNLPHATFLGHDAQLEAGIARLNAMAKADPIPPLVAGPMDGVK